MDGSVAYVLPIFLFLACAVGLAVGLLLLANLLNPNRLRPVEPAPYESGMDPIHDTHRRFDVRFYLLAIAFLVFDVELLFLYPWAVAWRPEGSAQLRAQGDRPTATARQQQSGRGEEGERGRQAYEQTRRHGEGAMMEYGSLPVSPSLPLPLAASKTPAPPMSQMFFPGAMVFLALLTVGYVYDWRKGVFQWR
jgi:NADH-quinone oxidoreductase subunit A